jgi:hypothetical protein
VKRVAVRFLKENITQMREIILFLLFSLFYFFYFFFLFKYSFFLSLSSSLSLSFFLILFTSLLFHYKSSPKIKLVFDLCENECGRKRMRKKNGKEEDKMRKRNG